MATCSVSGCDRPYCAKGFCALHYERWQIHGNPQAHIPAPARSFAMCAIQECGRPVRAKGLCASHYRRGIKTGDFTDTRPLRPPFLPETERFWAAVDSSGGPNACWPWQGQRLPDGYGSFHDSTQPHGRRKTSRAHRKAYELTKGPIPPEKEIDHMCHDARCTVPPKRCPHRACCNPAHLQVVTHRENVHRSNRQEIMTRMHVIQSALRKHQRDSMTHCWRGHAMTPENTYTSPGRVTKVCRTCQSLLKKLRKQRARQQQRVLPFKREI